MEQEKNRKLTPESAAIIEQIMASNHPQDVKDDLIAFQHMLDAMPDDAVMQVTALASVTTLWPKESKKSKRFNIHKYFKYNERW